MDNERFTPFQEKIKEKITEAIKEDFKQNGLDPEVVDEIGSWGDLIRLPNAFLLVISGEDGERITNLNFSFDVDGHLELTRYHPEDETRVPRPADVDLYGFNNLLIDNSSKAEKLSMPGSLRLEADFGSIGKHLAWLSRDGEFIVESSVGKIRG